MAIGWQACQLELSDAINDRLGLNAALACTAVGGVPSFQFGTISNGFLEIYANFSHIGQFIKLFLDNGMPLRTWPSLMDKKALGMGQDMNKSAQSLLSNLNV